ncbi:MAG: LytTR family transcriptional regulator [Clostridia bacterium]|nr:LytTR family transcriptional regulator [Clostridia bacterium]
MKYTLNLDKKREEEIIIFAHEKNELIESIEKLVQNDSVNLIGYKGQQIFKLDLKDIFCFTVEDSKIYAILEKEKLLVKQRLYSIEQMLDNGFVKINQSCIANIKKIDHFDASISGSLIVIFKNGYRDYVSRRQIKSVKERIGIK